MTDTDHTKRNRELVVDLLEAYRNWIGAALAVVGFVLVAIAAGAIGWTFTGVPSPPLWADVALGCLVVSAFGGVILGVITAGLLSDPLDHILVDLGQTPDSEFAIWGMNNPAFDEMEADGDLHEYPTAAGGWRAHEILEYHEDDHRAEASWKGALSQREQAQNEAKIDYNTRILERKAQLGEYIYMNRGSLLRDGLRQYTRKLNEALEGATLPGTSELESIFNEVTNGLEDRTDVDERERQDGPSRAEVDAATSSPTAAADGGSDE